MGEIYVFKDQIFFTRLSNVMYGKYLLCSGNVVSSLIPEVKTLGFTLSLELAVALLVFEASEMEKKHKFEIILKIQT